MKTGTALLVALMLGASLSASAKPLTFKIGDDANRDLVSFTSDAPIELIVGNTHAIDGSVVIDDSLDLSKKPMTATFNVDLSKIDTGIPLRNEHMRDNFLETAKYPKATFTMKSLASPEVLKPGVKTKVMVAGDFMLHGKTVQKTVPVYVTYLKKCPMTEAKMKGCDLLQISAQFPVAYVKDHGVQRPEIVFQKLADTVDVKVAATAYIKTAPATAMAPKTK
jgi:polyisoprenoid-binding protein YceI